MLEFFRTVWSKNVAGKLTLILGGLVLLGALVGTTYAVVTRPGDLTFMQREGHELRWERSDLPVDCFYLPAVTDAYLAAYGRERASLREAAGGELLGPCVPWRLDPPEHAPDGSLLLRLRPEEGTAHGAETRHRFDKRSGRILSADVALDRGLPADLLDRVVLHELGHVLGLDHDRESSSVMFEVASGRPKALSGRDVDALVDAYVR